MQGWVDLCYVKADRLGIEPRPVSRKSNALLPLSHHVIILLLLLARKLEGALYGVTRCLAILECSRCRWAIWLILTILCILISLRAETADVGISRLSCMFAWNGGCVADVDEMPFEVRNVAIERGRCFTDEFEIVDFLGRYRYAYR